MMSLRHDKDSNPTVSFTILEPQDQVIGELLYDGQERRAMDFKAPKLWNGQSGR